MYLQFGMSNCAAIVFDVVKNEPIAKQCQQVQFVLRLSDVVHRVWRDVLARDRAKSQALCNAGT